MKKLVVVFLMITNVGFAQVSKPEHAKRAEEIAKAFSSKIRT